VDAAWSAGRVLSIDAAVALALAGAAVSHMAPEACEDEPVSNSGARPNIVPGRPPDRLSVREVEVLRLLAAGKSNREIAAALVLSPNTVYRHVSSIFDKTGATNRTEAALYAHRHGLAE
jgi:NarL family two-component system response regulator LiaR